MVGSASVTEPEAWLDTPGVFHGEWQGAAHGADICVIVNRIEAPGGGPRLHRHPYAETFLTRRGHALFTVGDARIEAGEGRILVVPANTPAQVRQPRPRPPGDDRRPRERNLRHRVAGLSRAPFTRAADSR